MITATKTRIIQLDEPLSIETITLIKSVLLGLIGVQNIKINITNIYVTYQLKHVKETRIEVALDELEIAIKNKWFERLRYRLLHQYAEKETE